MTRAACPDCRRIVDADDARYHADGCPQAQTATVTVYSASCPCGCAGRPWFMCSRLAARHVAAYRVEGLVDCPSRPTRAGFDAVARLHPGCELVCLPPGGS